MKRSYPSGSEKKKKKKEEEAKRKKDSGSLLKFITKQTDKVPLPNADDENLPATSTSSGIVATQPVGCHEEQEETPEAHRAPIPSYDTDDFPATSTSSGIVATHPVGCHDEQEETPEAHRAPIPSYDTDDFPATSTYSGIVATHPVGCHDEQEETPEAHRAPIPSYDTDNFPATSTTNRTGIRTPHHDTSAATTTGLTTSEDPAEWPSVLSHTEVCALVTKGPVQIKDVVFPQNSEKNPRGINGTIRSNHE
ncbi:mucin-5AC-like [Fundulus heteroclitus]|uniref:mucin-5AC-like n=1 Tax=Fundulus heteroclitus TaxID=8078 RepID=UPI00165BBB65|nr:mucin-5AC-like [Fundulus heteroclitus]